MGRARACILFPTGRPGIVIFARQGLIDIADNPIHFPHVSTACLSTGSEPNVLAPDADSWWCVRISRGVCKFRLTFRPSATSGPNLLYMEKLFGISRGLVPLSALAKVRYRRVEMSSGLIARLRPPLSCRNIWLRCLKSLDVARSPPQTTVNVTNCILCYRGGSMIDPARRRTECLPEIWLTDQRFKHVVSSHLLRCEHNARASDRGWPTSKISLLRDAECLPADDPTVQQKVKDCLAQCLECVKRRMGIQYACPASSDSGASILVASYRPFHLV